MFHRPRLDVAYTKTFLFFCEFNVNLLAMTVGMWQMLNISSYTVLVYPSNDHNCCYVFVASKAALQRNGSFLGTDRPTGSESGPCVLFENVFMALTFCTIRCPKLLHSTHKPFWCLQAPVAVHTTYIIRTIVFIYYY